MLQIFGSGTACVVSPVGKILHRIRNTDKYEELLIPTMESKSDVMQRLFKLVNKVSIYLYANLQLISFSAYGYPIWQDFDVRLGPNSRIIKTLFNIFYFKLSDFCIDIYKFQRPTRSKVESYFFVSKRVFVFTNLTAIECILFLLLSNVQQVNHYKVNYFIFLCLGYCVQITFISL